MLVLNKSLQESEIIVTLTGQVFIKNPVFFLKLHSYYTSKTYMLTLGENVSPHTERYDLFYIGKEQFEGIEEGIYLFNIYEANDLEQSVEIGYLKVISNQPADEVITPNSSETDDDVIVYDN